jgi:hypothetical protein
MVINKQAVNWCTNNYIEWQMTIKPKKEGTGQWKIITARCEWFLLHTEWTGKALLIEQD